ncbi:MAG: hypothetical protein ACYCY9_03155 [Thiobacillus sp.]
MPYRLHRLLMFWCVIALQAMAPFIHAHAGAVQLGHADLPHVHQGAHGDAAYHAVVNGEHGAEVAVAHGLPARHAAAAGEVAGAPLVALGIPPAAIARGASAVLRAPPPFHLSSPDHIRPHALAPPAV